MDNAMVGGGWRYQHNYASNPWPTNGSAVDFYFRMPTDMSGIGESGFTYNNGTISFSYTTPESASAQQDILFGYRSASKSDYQTSLPNGIPVLLNHALTGVKFAIAEDVKATIMINSVSFSGIIDKGTCTVTPASENAYRDNITNYSSATAAVWSDTTRTAGKVYSSAYTDTVTYAKNTAGSFDSAGDYPASFSNGGNKNNLDDADGNAAQTFWLIPQKLTAHSTLTINYTVKSSPEATTGTTYEYTIDFGKTLKDKSVEWKAGELHTYTIRVDDVNVKIEDTVTPGTSGIVGSVKKAVTITNTGNTDAFIRAAIVGQWVIDKTVNGNVERQIMFGFTDEVNNLYQVESWYEDQFVTHAGTHGVFDGLAGYKNNNPDTPKDFSNPYPATAGWYYKDGYYYFTKSVAKGEATDTPLFNSYTISKVPHATNAGVVLSGDMYFTLEIATQAISARNLDGSLKPDSEYLTVWEAATAIGE